MFLFIYLQKDSFFYDNNDSKNNLNMGNKTSYLYQKELLNRLKETLEIFREDMSNVARNYKNSVQNLHDTEGLMDETFDEYYVNYLNPTVEILNSILERIDTEDLSFIEKEINFLSSR